MLKNIAQLKDTIDGKDFVLHCENDAPLSSMKEFLFRCLKYVGQIEDHVRNQQEKSKSEQSSELKEETKPE